jgi:hypothetical protein
MIRKAFKAQPAEAAPDSPQCIRCRWYDRIKEEAALGYCRRFPILMGTEWPTVYPTDWCGEYLTASVSDDVEHVEHLSIAEAGKRYFGLSVNGSYLAAKRGDLPWVKIGSRKRVPIAALQHLTPRE